MDKKRQTDSDYPQPEAEKRRDELLGNLLHMPPEQRKDRPKKRDAQNKTPRPRSPKEDVSD